MEIEIKSEKECKKKEIERKKEEMEWKVEDAIHSFKRYKKLIEDKEIKSKAKLELKKEAERCLELSKEI